MKKNFFAISKVNQHNMGSACAAMQSDQCLLDSTVSNLVAISEIKFSSLIVDSVA